jgi:hypothetical protein
MLIKVNGEYLEIGKERIDIGPGLNSLLVDALARHGGKKLGQYSGVGLETKSISAKLATDIIETIIKRLTKEDTYTAAVRVAAEDAGPMKNWCKVFQLEKYDVLLRKDYHEEDKLHALSFHIYHIEKGLDMNIKIMVGSEEKMNDSFERMSAEGVDVFAKQMTQFL